MISMKDVALAAGVSQPAVSYAYNRPGKLSEAQRKHILEVAERLGYPGPNVMGRSLRSGKVGAIGLMMMDKLSYAFADPYIIALLRGISEVGELSNVALTLFPLNNRRIAGKAAVAGAGDSSLAVRGLVDGLIISTLPDNHPTVQAIIKQKIPFVVVDAPLIAGAPFVGIEDRSGAQQQIRHLFELGHRKIGVMIERLNPDGFCGRVDLERFQGAGERIVRERLFGYLDAAADIGLGFDDLVMIEAGGLDYAAGQRAALALLGNHDITGVVACSDVMALACMDAARQLGRSVPEALSVIGFDDIPEALGAGLTTLRQPMIEKGVYAARLLIELLNAPAGEPQTPQRKIFPVELVVRGSTAPVRG